jgi:hypothetical protein
MNLYESTEGIAGYWSNEKKRNVTVDLLQDIEQRLLQEDPVQAIRTRILDYVLWTASYDVLTREGPQKIQGISGGLAPYVPNLIEVDEDLNAFFWSLSEPLTTHEDIRNMVVIQHYAMGFVLNCYNCVRIALEDYHVDRTKDWLRPCYASLCIWKENSYRTTLGLPSAIEGKNPELRAMYHMLWIKLAEQGHKNLRFVWDKAWTECFNEPSPYAGLILE